MLRPLAAATLLTALLPMAGCDSPACVYSPGGCNGPGGDANGGGPGAAGSAPADTLRTGLWVDADGPSEAFLGAGFNQGLHPGSILAVEFDVSMSQASLAGAFEIVDLIFGNTVDVVDPPPLVGDGRVALVVPAAPLIPGSAYALRFRQGAEPADVLGRVGTLGGDIGTFEVTGTPPEEPRLLYSFPSATEENAGDLTELVLVFDRPLDPSTVTLGSIKVEVGPGVPALAEPAQPVVVTGAVPIPVLQAWTWALNDAAGERDSLGAGVDVRFTISPAVTDQTGAAMQETVGVFQVSDLIAPVAVRKPFAPVAAIGLADLAPFAPLLEVELASPVPNTGAVQTSGYALGGKSRANGGSIALLRTQTPAEGEQLIYADTETLGFTDALGLPYLADGEVRIVAWNARGEVRSQARLLDPGPATSADHLILDTVPPVVVGLDTNGSQTDLFTSDQRDLVLVGRATEEIGFVHVEAIDPSTGDRITNEVLTDLDDPASDRTTAPVVFSGDAGLFIAQPAPIGVVDPLEPWTFDYQVFDLALNSAPIQIGVPFEQRGVLASPAAPTGSLTVSVYDQVTKEPLEGVRVLVHDRSGAAQPTLIDSGTTGAGGTLTLSTGANSVLVTAEAAGWDLVTFDGVSGSSIQLLLSPVQGPPAQAQGAVRIPIASGLDVTNALVQTLAADARAPEGAVPLVLAEDATVDDQTAELVQEFGPYALRPGVLGAQSALVVLGGLPLGSFSGAAFLLGFGLRAPSPPLPAGNTPSPIRIEVPGPLATQAAEARALDTGALPIPLTLPAAGDGLPDYGTLAAAPLVLVEARSPGLSFPWICGGGVSGQGAGGAWQFKAAWPGALDVTSGPTDAYGELILARSAEPDLWARIDLVGDTGCRATARWSVAGANPLGLAPPSPPFPAFVATGSVSVEDPVPPPFRVILRDPTPNSRTGAHLLRLHAETGRRWHLWKLDDAAQAAVSFWVPEVGLGEAEFPFQVGLELEAASYEVPALDPGLGAVWSELERTAEAVLWSPRLPAFNQ